MATGCHSCGSTNTYYDEGETYCTSCGLVLSEDNLISYEPTVALPSQADESLKRDICSSYIERYGRHLGIAEVDVEAAKQRLKMYRKVQSTIRAPQETAISLLFIACQSRIKGWRIIDFIDPQLNLDTTTLLKTHKHVQALLAVPQQEFDLVQQVDIVLTIINEPLATSFPMIDQSLLIATAKKVLMIADEYGLLMGRHTRTCVAACLIISAASQPTPLKKNRRNYERKSPYPKSVDWDSLSTKLSCWKRTLRDRYIEVLDTLCKYAKNLPKFGYQELTKNNIHMHLEDILSLKAALATHEAVDSHHEQSIEKAPPAFDRAQKERAIRAAQIAKAEACLADSELDPSHLDLETYRIYLLLSKHSKSALEDMSDVQLAYQLQSLMQDTPAKARDLDRTEVDEEDISDGEVETYIRLRDENVSSCSIHEDATNERCDEKPFDKEVSDEQSPKRSMLEMGEFKGIKRVCIR
ncbi:hypothetical protein DFQ28_001182 [Apophysomyces sp. BC1034]|nr:hypothetical protein DFQ30_007513 [Apophysomyces sp. BC1015]KAG0182055.1 hypothetical protein DFQ29_006036 [Apophysomyces sp. BC1021]KAG0190976.1 hypothetical protein DFQ28_001182 [Apophysomyces sp. BC1034]